MDKEELQHNLHLAKISKYVSYPMGFLFIIFFIYTLFFLAFSNLTTATITEINKSKRSGRFEYRPEYKYKVKGFTYYDRVSSKSNLYNYRIGDKIQVLYLKTNPNHSKINTFFEIWKGPLSFLITFLITYGFYYFIEKKKIQYEKKTKEQIKY